MTIRNGFLSVCKFECACVFVCLFIDSLDMSSSVSHTSLFHIDPGSFLVIDDDDVSPRPDCNRKIDQNMINA